MKNAIITILVLALVCFALVTVVRTHPQETAALVITGTAYAHALDEGWAGNMLDLELIAAGCEAKGPGYCPVFWGAIGDLARGSVCKDADPAQVLAYRQVLLGLVDPTNHDLDHARGLIPEPVLKLLSYLVNQTQVQVRGS